jgi:putative copper export protein
VREAPLEAAWHAARRFSTLGTISVTTLAATAFL